MLYPYYAMLYGTFGATMYCMCRMVLVRRPYPQNSLLNTKLTEGLYQGHKTWWGK